MTLILNNVFYFVLFIGFFSPVAISLILIIFVFLLSLQIVFKKKKNVAIGPGKRYLQDGSFKLLLKWIL